jgi:hypothetical protein
MSMKRIILAIILVTIVALSATLWIIYNQNSPSSTRISSHNVEITSFSIDKGWEYLGGLVITCGFNITLHNMGLNDVDDLKLMVQMFVNDTEVEVVNHWWGGVFNNGSINDMLRTGEVREFRGELVYSMGQANVAITNIGGHQIGSSYVAKVMLEDVVLDERWATLNY